MLHRSRRSMLHLLDLPLALVRFDTLSQNENPSLAAGVFCEGPGLEGAQFTLAARGTSCGMSTPAWCCCFTTYMRRSASASSCSASRPSFG